MILFQPQFDNIAKLQYLDRFFNEVLRLHGAAIRYINIFLCFNSMLFQLEFYKPGN